MSGYELENLVKFQVLTATIIKVAVLRDLTSCSLTDIDILGTSIHCLCQGDRYEYLPDPTVQNPRKPSSCHGS
jgi:hypothetical protein